MAAILVALGGLLLVAVGGWGHALIVNERLRGDCERERQDAARWREEAERARAGQPQGDPPWVRELLTRLLDTALPAKETAAVGDEPAPDTPGEYEAPDEGVLDWTDPFFGFERPLVGGLAPGQGIPGIRGDLGLDPYATAHMDEDDHLFIDQHPMANGYLPDDTAARGDDWREVGEELFEVWDQGR